jgi:hypothetical protein
MGTSNFVPRLVLEALAAQPHLDPRPSQATERATGGIRWGNAARDPGAARNPLSKMIEAPWASRLGAGPMAFICQACIDRLSHGVQYGRPEQPLICSPGSPERPGGQSSAFIPCRSWAAIVAGPMTGFLEEAPVGAAALAKLALRASLPCGLRRALGPRPMRHGFGRRRSRNDLVSVALGKLAMRNIAAKPNVPSQRAGGTPSADGLTMEAACNAARNTRTPVTTTQRPERLACDRHTSSRMRTLNKRSIDLRRVCQRDHH